MSKCSDIHECDRHAHNCDINAGCSNTEGSFACACNAGYDGDGENCVDVDECDAGLHNCDTNDAVFIRVQTVAGFSGSRVKICSFFWKIIDLFKS